MIMIEKWMNILTIVQDIFDVRCFCNTSFVYDFVRDNKIYSLTFHDSTCTFSYIDISELADGKSISRTCVLNIGLKKGRVYHIKMDKLTQKEKELCEEIYKIAKHK